VTASQPRENAPQVLTWLRQRQQVNNDYLDFIKVFDMVFLQKISCPIVKPGCQYNSIDGTTNPMKKVAPLQLANPKHKNKPGTRFVRSGLTNGCGAVPLSYHEALPELENLDT